MKIATTLEPLVIKEKNSRQLVYQILESCTPCVLKDDEPDTLYSTLILEIEDEAVISNKLIFDITRKQTEAMRITSALRDMRATPRNAIDYLESII